MVIAGLMAMAMSSGFDINRYVPSDQKPKQSDEEREQALLKAQQKRERKALKRGKK